MKLSELIADLQMIVESSDEDPEVLIAVQPNYPLQSHIMHVSELEKIDGEHIVYIVESSQVRDAPYAPREVFESTYIRGYANRELEDERHR